MTREEAWKRFQAAHQKQQEELRQTFCDNLPARIDELEQCIFDAFEEISQQAKEQKKEDCVYFLFSLQRYDLLEKKAIVRLDVLGMEWYLDEEPLAVDFDTTFLFQEYFDWQDALLLDMREYMGKVNKYDVGTWVQDEIMVCNQLVAQILRFVLRNLEQQEVFDRIAKPPFWIVRWGEYKDYSEILVQLKRDTRGQEIWEERLGRYKQNHNILTADYWYRENLTGGDCHGKSMNFIVFEECSLKGINFSRADLTGAKFLKCRIEECNFTDANLYQAVFSKEGFEPEWFDEKQLEEIFVVEKFEEEKEEI